MVLALSKDPQALIEALAKQLKEEQLVQAPSWNNFVKTGNHKERPPQRDDWWYVRSAAILRSVAKLGPIGTSKLRTKYGGRKSRGHKPKRFVKGSGSIIRNILKQLEKSQLVKQVEKGVHKGRVLTPKGVSLLDKASLQIKGKSHE